MLDVKPKFQETNFPALRRLGVNTLQVNLGYLCNLSCTHCHVNAGPTRKELMTRETIDLLLQYTDKMGIKTLDLTGGAPELNPDFRYLVKEARARGVHVMDRCNLTVLLEPGQEDLAVFLAGHEVEIVASLPCYTEDNVDKQRGKGVFDGSIKALNLLNKLGYGVGNPELVLSLVYNPNGAFLPPPQEALKLDYKSHLDKHFGISFDDLFTITNMPIARFGSTLLSKGTFDTYLDLLKSNFDSKNLDSVMCRTMLSVDWQGYVYDCDFNQMLEMPMIAAQRPAKDIIASDKHRVSLQDLLGEDLIGHPIYVKDHCFGCTAGQGSSCGGALE